MTSWRGMGASYAVRGVGRVPLAASAVSSPIEAALLTRCSAAAATADRARREHPDATPRELAEDIVHQATRLLGLSGAAAGGVSAVPTVGTVAAVAVVTAELGISLAALTEMVMAIGILYGHDASDIGVRRTWVLAVLAMAMEVDLDGSPGRGTAGEPASDAGRDSGIVRPGGAAAADRLSPQARRAVNQAVAGRLMVRLGVRAGVVQLGRLLPFGIGAAIGGVTSTRFVRAVGRSAIDFFSAAPRVVDGRVISSR